MEEKSKFIIVFKKSPDFKIFPAQVIFGGPVPDGSGILMNFGVDHLPIPNYTQHSIDGKVVDVNKVEQVAQVGNIEREIIGALYITTEQAKRTAKWLNEKVEEIERGRHE